MRDALFHAAQAFSGWLVHWAITHPIYWLSAWGFFWTLGYALKAAKITGKTLIGMAAFFFAVGWLWKRRRDVSRGVVVTATVVVVGGWALAIYTAPGRYRIALLVLAAAGLTFLFAPAGVLWERQPGGWLAEKTGDRPLWDVFREWVEGHQLHQQLVDELGVTAGVTRPKKVGADWKVGAETVGDPGRIDPHAVGARGNRVTTVRQVGVQPGDAVGSATITLSPEPPEPPMTPWERLAKLGPITWPGPSTSDLNAPMRVLFDAWGNVLPMPVPGLTGNNLLLTGPTGSGKTGGLHVIMADLSFRHDLAIIYLDPHAVEGALWEDRCSLVAKGVPDCARAVARLPAFMEARGRRMKGRSWSVRDDGPRVLLVFDEYASLSEKQKQPMQRWLAEGRKFGVGTIICLQRAERQFIELAQRDNCRVRIACGAESDEASRMTLGKEAPLATQIPESLKGGAIVRVERVYRPARFYLLAPPGPLGPDDDPMEIAAPQIARATRALRVDLGLTA